MGEGGCHCLSYLGCCGLLQDLVKENCKKSKVLHALYISALQKNNGRVAELEAGEPVLCLDVLFWIHLPSSTLLSVSPESPAGLGRTAICCHLMHVRPLSPLRDGSVQLSLCVHPERYFSPFMSDS